MIFFKRKNNERLPFDPVTYLQQDTGLDVLLKILIVPTVVLSAWFTADFLVGLWGFDTPKKRFYTIATAVAITALEVYTFRRFVFKQDYVALVIGFWVSIVSIMGSFGLFQAGFKKNEIKAEVMEIQKKKVKRLEKKSENFGKKKQIGNEWKAEKELDKSIKDLEKKTDKGVGSSNAIYEFIAGFFNTDLETAASMGNGFITILIEVALIFLAIRSAQEQVREKKQEIILMRGAYSAYGGNDKLDNDKLDNGKLDNGKSESQSDNANLKEQPVINFQPSRIEDYDNESLADIIYHCLEMGKYPPSARFHLRGKYRYNAVQSSLQRQGYNTSRQHVEKIFKRYWMYRKDDGMLPLVIEKYRRGKPAAQLEDIIKFTGLTAEELQQYVPENSNHR